MMMKQSSLLGTFVINEKRNTIAVEASPNVDNKKGSVLYAHDGQQRAETNQGKIFKEADPSQPKLDQSKKACQSASKETSSRKKSVTNGDAGENMSKIRHNSKSTVAVGKKKCLGKLSLSCKENGSASNFGLENANTDDAKPNQVVAYSDFLAEAVEAAKSPCRDNCKTKKENIEKGPANCQGERSTMSYNEFLSLFKPAPKEIDAPCEEMDNENLNISEASVIDSNQTSVPKCKSILSYFSKSLTSASPQGNSLRVVADVHSRKECLKSSSQTPQSPIKRKLTVGRTQLQEEANTIEYLGSEMLTEAVNIEDGMSVTKKRKYDHEATPFAEPKKHKVEDDKMLPEISMVANQNELDDCSAVPNKTTKPTAKTSQSQLSFGVGGLAFFSPKVEPLKTEQSEKRKTRGRPRKVSDIKENEKREPLDNSNTSQDEQTSTSSTSEAKTENPEVSLRRSSRTVRPVKPFMIQEVLDVDDDDEDVNCGKSHSRRHKFEKEKSSESEDLRVSTSKKKPKGPLAPIFTSMKPKEEVLPPQEDPEKVRLRREFMMSGIPEELKRQMVTNVSTVTADYPPFPKPSHVQQMDGNIENLIMGCISLPSSICWRDEGPGPQSDLSWKNLDWDPIVVLGNKKSFESFQNAATISESQQKYLLTKWQQNYSKFNFDKTMDHLMQHLKSPMQSSTGRAYSTDGSVSALPLPCSPGSSQEDEIVIIEDGKIEDSVKKVASADPSGCLWTDLHQPAKSEEVIGNVAVVEQLKSWLAEWKTVMQKDIKKARKASTLQTSKGKGDWSDDSDFTDSEEEDESLCNTMLMTGPHGIGKTAVVYALAQEIGYKVFEVNSSSLRSGKQILSQLEEATQSHRVATTKSQHPPQNKSTLTSEGLGGPTHSDKTSKKAKSKTDASAFAALFKTTGQSSGKALNQEESKKRKKGELFKKTDNQKESPCSDVVDTKSRKKSTSKKKSKLSGSDKLNKKMEDKPVVHKENEDRSQNLACLSLILFDEVDMVFEEDKGFLSTIEHFMATTKIPIILTSTVPASSLELVSRHDQIILKHPSAVSAVCYLCCVCVAHGIPPARQSLEKLYQFFGGDLRKCLLYLQFWCLSGGIRICDKLMSHAEHFTPNSSSNGPSLSSSQDFYSSDYPNKKERSVCEAACSDDSNGSQFLSLQRPLRKGRRMIIDDDDDEYAEDSRTVDQIVNRDTMCNVPEVKKSKRLSTKKSVCAMENNSSLVAENGSSGGADGTTCGSDVQLHLGVAESALGLSNGQLSSQALGYFIQCPDISSCELKKALHAVSSADHGLACNSIYQLALHFTSVPKCDLVTIQLTLPASKGPRRRRILERSWMDTDSSEDDTKVADNDLQKAASQSESGNVGVDSLGQVYGKNDSGAIINGEESCKKSFDNSEAESTKNQTGIENSTPERTAIGKSDEEEKVTNKTCLSMLSTLSQYHDAVSLVDTFQTFYNLSDREKQLSPGTSDEDLDPSANVHLFGSVLSSELPGTASLLASRTLYQGLGNSLNSWQSKSLEAQKFSSGGPDLSSWPEELSLPIGRNIPSVWDLSVKSQRKSPLDSTTKNVLSGLGAAVLQTDPVVHVDYLPYLRDICRSENARHLAKTQRRFHHYLDNAGLSLKKSTIACLTSTYTTDSTR